MTDACCEHSASLCNSIDLTAHGFIEAGHQPAENINLLEALQA